jgi:predicted anti-sigma-YlaC factor YlaD
MKCKEIYELMPNLAAASSATGEVDQHLRDCSECSAKLQEFRQTMALLDEWQAPEPSPYFDTRLQARLREEQAKQPVAWWQWLRRPALAASLALMMVVGFTIYRDGGPSTAVPATVEPGTAVGDLQALDKNHDLYSDFDVLDDLQVQQDVNANP